MADKTLGNLNGPWRLLVQVALCISPVLITAAVGMAVSLRETIGDQSRKLVAIQETAWTTDKQIEHDRRIAKEFATIWKAVADMKIRYAGLANSGPPQWFRRRMDKLESRMDRTDAAIASLNKSIK